MENHGAMDPSACLSALDSAENAIVITDLSGTILWVNAAFTQLTGYAAEEAVGQKPSILRSGHHDTLFYKNLWDTLLAGQHWRGEMINRRKDGTLYCEEQSISPVMSAGGKVTSFIAIKRDISRQKATEEALHFSEELNRAVLDAMPAHIAVLNGQGRIISVNAAWRRFAQDPGETTPRHAEAGSDYLAICRTAAQENSRDKAATEVAEGIQSVLDGRQAQFSMEFACDSPGEKRWCHMQVLTLAPKCAGAVVAHFDITGLKRTEEQLRHAQRLASVGRLAGGIAHDFNNILTVINGYSSVVLARLGENDGLRNPILKIHEAGSHASKLTGQLLAFSSTNKAELKAVDLNAVARGAENMIVSMLGASVELRMSLDSAIDPVLGDEAQLQRVLTNLAVNARDAMPAGGALSIETNRAKLARPVTAFEGQIPPGRYVVLTVRDSGTGIDQQTMGHIFEPFFTTKPKGKGSGLGLSTVYGIVRDSGGHIALDSEMGKGTRFSIYFPSAKAPVVEPS